jgi:hypothetical protein
VADEVLSSQTLQEHLDAHDKRMGDGRKDWQRYKAAYMTQFWKSQTGSRPSDLPTQIQVEVNRMYGVIESYLSALYPKASRVVVAPGPTLGGDSYKSELAANKWLAQNRTHNRLVKSIRQALLYPGSGLKIGVDDGPGDPLDRVWFRVIPWWELVLDFDVYDEEDARFIGHVYYRPLEEVEQQYGISGLRGEAREDFLDSDMTRQQNHPQNSRWYSGLMKGKAAADASAFVRVFEVCNLVDSYVHEGRSMRGRMDVYLPGQKNAFNEPAYQGPMPFSTASGDPMPHIKPLIFNSEPEYPLRGKSHASRIYPQISEINIFRSFRANAARRDSRQYLALDGVLTSDQMTMLTAGVDGLVIPVEDTKLQGRDLRNIVVPLQTAPISANIDKYEAQADVDLQRAAGTSPNAYGTVTKATATEIMNLRDYTESEFGRHAMVKDTWISDTVKLFIRALISAMETPASQGGIEDQRQDLEDGEEGSQEAWTVQRVNELEDSLNIQWEEGEDFRSFTEEAVGVTHLDDMSEEELEQLANALKRRAGSGEEEEEEEEPQEDAEEAEGEEAEEGEEEEGEEQIESATVHADIPPDILRIKDGNDVIEISVDDLDGDFLVEIVDSRTTPFTDAAVRQALLELLGPLQELWGIVQKGGPQSLLARAQMVSFVERFDLPPDMHPDALEAQMREEKEAKGTQAPPPAPGPGGNVVPMVPPDAQPPPGPPGPGGGSPLGQIPPEMQQQLLSMPPAQAIQTLLQALEQTGGAPPELMQLLQQALSLPPQQQAEVVQQVVGGGA